MITYTLDKSEFVNLFDQYNRSENFTRASREALFDYYDDLSDSTGVPFEMDVIAICCDWSEYTPEELEQQFQHINTADPRDFDALLGALSYEHTTVIDVDTFDGTLYLVQAF